MFKYVSLFSGIGGFEQALSKIGGECVFASEIDKFAAQSYEALYGHKPHGDVTQIDAKDVPDHDLITAGFPCVAFSVAGKRAGMIHVCSECGFEQNISFREYISEPKCDCCGGELKPKDPRGVLFFEIARIALTKQPSALLIENVKGLVNHDKGRTLDTMIRTLNDIGYVVDFEILNSKYFGVPQNRERIFIVAVRSDLIEAEPFSEDSTTGQTIVPKGKRRIGEWAKTFNFDWPKQCEVTTRLRDILEEEVDEKYYLDEEKTAKLVAQLEEKEPTIKQGEITVLGNMGRTGHGNFNVFSDEGISRTVAARDYKDPIRIAEPHMLGHVDIKGHDAIRRVYAPSGISPTLTTMGGGHREPKIADKHGVAIGVKPRYRIRKLTPLECWRLQGFPDLAHEAVKDAGISDSQRYKQAGNAVTVNVISAITSEMLRKGWIK